MSALSAEEGDDLLDLVCGGLISHGTYRSVFECKPDPKSVVKKDNRKNFSNINEFQVWEEFQDTKLGKWLAPCWHLSPSGIWLIQAKTEPIPVHLLPKRVPALLADIKQSNWGFYEGRPVCHDYGNHSVFAAAKEQSGLLKKAEWRLY